MSGTRRRRASPEFFEYLSTCGGHKWNFQTILLKFVCFPLFVVLFPHFAATLPSQVGYIPQVGKMNKNKKFSRGLVVTMWRAAARLKPLRRRDPWGDTIPQALCFLVVREIDCGNWLARGYMPAHQHCELFYLLAGDLIGSTLN